MCNNIAKYKAHKRKEMYMELVISSLLGLFTDIYTRLL